MIILGIIIGLLVGTVIGWLYGRSVWRPLITGEKARADFSEKETQQLRSQLTDVRREADEHLKALKQEMEETEQRHLSTMKEQFSALAQEVLDTKSRKLTEDADQHLSLLLKPLRERIDLLDTAIKDTNEKDAGRTTHLDEIIRQLSEQTAGIGLQAEHLTRALKGNSKTQGDWGEMILDSILEKSGLRRDEEYFVQESFKDEDQRNLRPDVVVRFPDNRSVIIDSKVSLTAFADYVASVTDEERTVCLKRHVDSVRKHIDELSAKDYPSVVKDADDFVLMFMPNESAYIAALKAEPSLNLMAHDKHVIITCPTILIMTLHMIYNIWQSDAQTRNMKQIIESTNQLYDKFVLFSERFVRLGTSFDHVQRDYQDALKQLSEGRGNIVRRVDHLRRMGLKVKKNIPDQLLDRSADEDDEQADDAQ